MNKERSEKKKRGKEKLGVCERSRTGEGEGMVPSGCPWCGKGSLQRNTERGGFSESVWKGGQGEKKFRAKRSHLRGSGRHPISF